MGGSCGVVDFYLLSKLLDKMGKKFLEEGGFRERMTKMRVEKRKKKE